MNGKIVVRVVRNERGECILESTTSKMYLGWVSVWFEYPCYGRPFNKPEDAELYAKKQGLVLVQ